MLVAVAAALVATLEHLLAAQVVQAAVVQEAQIVLLKTELKTLVEAAAVVVIEA
jgi:hypothetical protein